MATNEYELNVLKNAIRLFHSHTPHSRKRKEVISNTLQTLRGMSSDPKYWNSKRIRTWFWNHRAQVNDKLEDTLTIVTPKSKIVSTAYKMKLRGKHSNSQEQQIITDNNYIIEQNNILYDKSKNNIPSPNLIQAVNNNNTSDNISNIIESNDNELSNDDSSNDIIMSEKNNNLDNENSLQYPCNKTWRIYACKSFGSDCSDNERWLQESTGIISFNWCSITGYIDWEHEYKYNKFKGNLSIIKQREEPQWTEYLMNGKIGCELMKQLNYTKKHSFLCNIRRILDNQVKDINNKLDCDRKKDINIFGEDEYNNKIIFNKLKIQPNDIEAKLHYYSTNGNINGVTVYARRIEKEEELYYWKPKNKNEILLAIQILQNKLMNIEKDKKE